MTATVGSGAFTIRAALADGRIRAAEIVSTRPSSLSRLFVGRPAAQAPVLAGRLFSLCGYSHAVASSLAIAAAQGQDVKGGFAVGLLAERLGDYFRSLVMGWPDVGIAGCVSSRNIGGIRDVLSACGELGGGGASPKEAVHRIKTGAQALGLGSGDALLQQALSALPQGQVFLSAPPDALSAGDDAAVCEALSSRGEAFSSAPYLSGRCPETGAYAQCFSAVSSYGSALSDRMRARFAYLESAIRQLDDAESAQLCSSGSPHPGQGYGAVESPRGRLYHWVKLNAAKEVADYGIVSPTEWNFHPAGPFVATVLGAKVGTEGTAQGVISWLAALFDPCVTFRVMVEGEGRA